MTGLRLSDLLAMAKAWFALDIPLYVVINGHELRLDYAYCGTDGVRFRVSPPEGSDG